MADDEKHAIRDDGFGGTTVPRFTALYFETELGDSDDEGLTAHGNSDGNGTWGVRKSRVGVKNSGEAEKAARRVTAAAVAMAELEAHELASQAELKKFAEAAKRLVDARRAADKVLRRRACGPLLDLILICFLLICFLLICLIFLSSRFVSSISKMK